MFTLYKISNRFCILVHDYNLCFTGYPCYNVGCYKYNSTRHYYIVIHKLLLYGIDSLSSAQNIDNQISLTCFCNQQMIYKCYSRPEAS